MKYAELLIQAEAVMTGLGIRDYCQKICHGGCCSVEGAYRCDKHESCGVAFCRERLPCSAFVCRRLLGFLGVIAPVTAEVLQVVEEKVRHAVSGWLADRGRLASAPGDEDLFDLALSEQELPSAFFSDYTFEEIADLEIAACYPSTDASAPLSLPADEVAAVRGALARLCSGERQLRGRSDYRLTRIGETTADRYEARTYLGSDRKKYMIVRPHHRPDLFGFFGPVSRDYPYELPWLMPGCRVRSRSCSGWEEAADVLASEAGL